MSTSATISVKDFSSLIGTSTHLIYKLIKEKKLEIIAQRNRKALPPFTIRHILLDRGFEYSPEKKPLLLNIFGMKGGIGKTSIATAIAEGASRLGFRVLAVDLDMQSNMTQSFNKKQHGQPVLRDIVIGEKNINEIIVNVHPCLDLIPSSLDNSLTEHFLSTQTINIVGYLRDIFEQIYNNYDLIIMDCPPAINKITACAVCHADLNLIPVNADMDAFDGVMMSVSEIKMLENRFKDFNLNIAYKILFNKYDAREKLSLTIMGEIAKEELLNQNLLSIVIRTDTTFKNTKATGDYIFDTRKSSAKEDCFSLITEITGINKWLKEKNTKKTSQPKNMNETAAA